MRHNCNRIYPESLALLSPVSAYFLSPVPAHRPPSQILRHCFDGISERSSRHRPFVFHHIREDLARVWFAGLFQHPPTAFLHPIVPIVEQQVCYLKDFVEKPARSCGQDERRGRSAPEPSILRFRPFYKVVDILRVLLDKLILVVSGILLVVLYLLWCSQARDQECTARNAFNEEGSRECARLSTNRRKNNNCLWERPQETY